MVKGMGNMWVYVCRECTCAALSCMYMGVLFRKQDTSACQQLRIKACKMLELRQVSTVMLPVAPKAYAIAKEDSSRCQGLYATLTQGLSSFSASSRACRSSPHSLATASPGSC